MATRRSGLGRGLGALIPPSVEQPDAKAGSNEVIDLRDGVLREVPIAAVSPNAYQPRTVFDEKALQPLADSIKELGVLQPILVRPTGKGDDKYELIAGERRWRASKMAGLKNIPALVRQVEDLQSLQEALVENLHRKDLNPIDEAAAYRQLIDDFSMTHEEIAKRVGKSRTVVSNLLRLQQLQPKIQKMLMDERLTEGHARALLGTEDAAFQMQLAERATKEGMTVRAIEEAVRLRNELAKPQTKKRKGAAAAVAKSSGSVAALEWQERLRDALDTRVTIASSGKNGRVVIEFADDEDLDRIGQIIESGSDFED